MSLALGMKGTRCVHKLCKEGKLFKSVTDLKMVEGFVGHFKAHGTASTVRTKAVHLKKLADFASLCFSEVDERELSGKAAAVSEYLRCVSCVQKGQARREHRARKTQGARVERGDILDPEDFGKMLKVTKDCLKNVMESVKVAHKEGGTKAVKQLVRGNKKLARKWCMHLIALLILEGGGQRPQVCCQLQLPTAEETRELKILAQTESLFELRTVWEKTARALDCPNVSFPSSLFEFVRFHANVVRPSTVAGLSADESQLTEKTLLIHTESGDPLISSQITSTLRKVITREDPEKKKVTCMSVRGSYGTLMMQLHREGKVMNGKSEEMFLEHLGKLMNTSPEQLRNACVGTSGGDFRDMAREFMDAFRKNNEDAVAEETEAMEELSKWASGIWG